MTSIKFSDWEIAAIEASVERNTALDASSKAALLAKLDTKRVASAVARVDALLR